MLKRTLVVKVLLLIFPLFICLRAAAVAPKYPAIIEWQGDVWVTGKDAKRVKLARKQVLREKALLETSISGQVKVQLDEKRRFVILGSSEVSLPVISWESGDAPVVILKNGELFWQQGLKEKGPFNVALRSDLFEFIAPPGSYVLLVDKKKAFAGVKMYEGSMEFSALNGDESVQVKSGQQVGFQGVLEGDEISYDVLLKGKKIPKGQLTAVTPMDSKELEKFAEIEKKRLKEMQVQQARKRQAQEQAKKEGVICLNPPGKFNECVWTCLNNPKKEKKRCLLEAGTQCERRRCNANGVWAEETLVGAEKAGSQCSLKPTVGPCDY